MFLWVCVYVHTHTDFPGGSVVKNPPATAGAMGSILGSQMETNSRILAWEIPWTEEPRGLQSIGSQKSWT